MKSNKDSKYWAANTGTTLSKILMEKVNNHFTYVRSTYPNSAVEKMFALHFGIDGPARSDSLTTGGQRGEKTYIHENVFRQVLQNVLNFVTGQPITYSAEGINSDAKSRAQAMLSNDLLNTLVFQTRLNEKRKTVGTFSLLADEGYYYITWNSTKGAPIIDEDGRRIPEGEISIEVLPPWLVASERRPDGPVDEWKIAITFVNKYDLAVTYPEHADGILALECPPDLFPFLETRYTNIPKSDDYIALYEFYHDRTPALPNGAYMSFVSADIWLVESDPSDEERGFGYPGVPLIRVTSDDIAGISIGRSPMRDLIAMNEALNHNMSVIVSNAIQHGHRNMTSPVGNGVDRKSLPGGYNIIYYTKEAPRPMEAPTVPPEIYRNAETLPARMKQQLGLNDASTGSIESSSRLSSSSLSMLEQKTIQFLSSFQQSDINALERLGTFAVKLYQLYAKAPRVISLVGENNKRYVIDDFSGQKIKDIDRVKVLLGSAMAATPTQRYDIADKLMNAGAFESPVDFLDYINTGSLRAFTEAAFDKKTYVKRENEKILRGEVPQVLVTDDHTYHAREHMKLSANPEVTENPEVAKALTDHVMAHFDAASEISPELAAFFGHTPITIPTSEPQASEPPPGESPPAAAPPTPVPESA